MAAVRWFVLVVALASGVCVQGAHAEAAHVRGLTSRERALVARGWNESPSFRALVERLNRSDVVVYVMEDRFLPRSLAARLAFMTSEAGTRYLLVRLSPRLKLTGQVASLGHELQHAVEIANRPRIVDSTSLAKAYASFAIGQPPAHGSTHVFDTHRAIAATRRILRELREE